MGILLDWILKWNWFAHLSKNSCQYFISDQITSVSAATMTSVIQELVWDWEETLSRRATIDVSKFKMFWRDSLHIREYEWDNCQRNIWGENPIFIILKDFLILNYLVVSVPGQQLEPLQLGIHRLNSKQPIRIRGEDVIAPKVTESVWNW